MGILPFAVPNQVRSNPLLSKLRAMPRRSARQLATSSFRRLRRNRPRPRLNQAPPNAAQSRATISADRAANRERTQRSKPLSFIYLLQMRIVLDSIRNRNSARTTTALWDELDEFEKRGGVGRTSLPRDGDRCLIVMRGWWRER